ncbi:hypothetical protein BD410DRAFT_786359 [Rickenella mellea]|uniref:Zinc-finger domain-containing protein n=1 Tax=Rickenella mellea TaxID=50990 RepID=A0A4Y7QBP8_9AGAM|nr:hypothetical protein BD410DRAFT_786359 [Rickenella mellea]
MSSTPASTKATPLSSVKRKSIVYVDIPPSPLHGSGRMFPTPPTSTPLSPKALFHNRGVIVDIPVLMKKRKSEDSEEVPAKKKKTAPKLQDFPNGSFNCHQCGKRRDINVELRCTRLFPRCKTKYCYTCLKNRYGQDASEVKKRGLPMDILSRQINFLECGYVWKCPKCSDTCNCSHCRKAKGLEPTGNLTLVAKKAGNSVAALLAQNPNATGILPGKGQQVVPTKKEKVPKEPKASSSKDTTEPKVRKPRKKVQVPEPTWVEVPTDLDRAETEDRFMLREFVLRFSPIMDISAKHLEDLDEFDTMSDACAKALLMNLLGLIAADAEPHVQTALKRTIKKISGGGINPNALWTNLVSLRDQVGPSSLSFPDPTPATTGTLRTRAGGGITQSVQLIPVFIALVEAAIQGASVRAEIENGAKDMKDANRDYFAAAREENERWVAEKKELTEEKTGKEGNEGWDADGWTAKYKASYKRHKTTLENLEHANERKLQSNAPRFQPLGKDADGRIYYVSSAHTPKKVPAADDRASMKKWSWFLAVWGRRKAEDDPETSKAGSRGTDSAANDDGDEGDQDDNEARWWGFSDPMEIKKLAKWLASTSIGETKEKDGRVKDGKEGRDKGHAHADDAGGDGFLTRASSPLSDVSDSGEKMDMDKTPVDIAGQKVSNMKALVKALNEYADFLQWRVDGEGKGKN